MNNEEYYAIDPPNPLPGSLTAILPSSQRERYDALVEQRSFTRFIVRCILADSVPLSGDLIELLKQESTSLLYVNEEPLTIDLDYPGYLPSVYDLHSSTSGALSHIDFRVDTNHPLASLAIARTAVNQLLDVLMRVVWLPLVIFRLDVFIRDEPEPILHQLTVPFVDKLAIGPLGGFLSFAPLAPYEALLREAIGATSPYYRFVCAFRLLEGVNYLRGEIRKLVEKFGVQEKMPKPPQIDAIIVTGLGFDQGFAGRVNSIDSLIKEFKEARNAAAHFLLDRDAAYPLHISDGNTYRTYSSAGTLLLFYAHASIRDLMVYFNQYLHQHLARGRIAFMPEDKEHYVVRFDAYTGKFGPAIDEEEDMNRPMFIKVIDGRKIEFINISHIVRVEILHPGEGQPGSGTLHLQDGTARTLHEDEINEVMRMMPGLLGEPAVGTQNATPGYWTNVGEPGPDSAPVTTPAPEPRPE